MDDSSKNTILWLISERNSLVYKVRTLEENQEKILNLLKKNNISFKNIEKTQINTKELFDDIYNKYKTNDSINGYGIYRNNSCISLSITTNFCNDKRDVDIDINIYNNCIDLFIKDELVDNHFCIYNIKDIDLIYNTIDLILNNYSIENIKSLGFK